MKKEVIVCDVCTDNFAKVKCDYCGNEICLECGSILYFQKGQNNDYLIHLSRHHLTSSWLKNESIKHFIVCQKCEKEIADTVDGFAKLPIEKRKIIEGELIRIMKERMDALLLANKL